jgi:hypothetical protein
MGLRNGKNHLKIGDSHSLLLAGRITAIAITLTILVFLIYYEFTAMLPGYAPPDCIVSLHSLDEWSSRISAHWHLVSSLPARQGI